ncbi:hypothetical protein CRENBAI_021335 [Crenichthys baileyi]|uniref:Uncharacterized protein n=1 Tax=Crenichthys baileyi TaxID=28760 RepID=A0AAV9QQ68_9TELE
MLPARLHSGVLRYTAPDRMFPPNMELADGRQESASDRWVQQQMEEALRHMPADLEVLPSPLLLEQMEREAVQRRSPPATLVAHPDPAAKPTSSSRRKKRRCGAPSCFSAGEEVGPMPTDVRAAGSNPASVSATALSPRLGAAPPAPSSLAQARCSEATPDEMEEREKIRQMEEDYETAVRQFYCRPPPSSSALQSSAAAQSMPGLQRGVAAQSKPGLQGAATEQPMPGVQGAAAKQPTLGLQSSAAAEQPTADLQSATAAQSTSCLQDTPLYSPSLPQPPPHTAEDVIIGTPRLKSLGVPATLQPLPPPLRVFATPQPLPTALRVPATPQPLLKPLRVPATPQPLLKQLKVPVTPQPLRTPLRVSATPQPLRTPLRVPAMPQLLLTPLRIWAFRGFKERLVLILTCETGDEKFEDELPPDPVPDRSEEKLLLVLASEPRDEGFKEEAPPDPVSKGVQGAACPSSGL